jgi:hypothetical protein
MAASRGKTPPASLPQRNGKMRSPSPSKAKKSPPLQGAVDQSPIPNYLSSVHRPSTNPSFVIDSRSGCDFADWTDLSAERLKVEILGRVQGRIAGKTAGTPKGKEKEETILPDVVPESAEWKVLADWHFDLSDLIPLPDDVRTSV